MIESLESLYNIGYGNVVCPQPVSGIAPYQYVPIPTSDTKRRSTTKRTGGHTVSTISRRSQSINIAKSRRIKGPIHKEMYRGIRRLNINNDTKSTDDIVFKDDEDEIDYIVEEDGSTTIIKEPIVARPKKLGNAREPITIGQPALRSTSRFYK